MFCCMLNSLIILLALGTKTKRDKIRQRNQGVECDSCSGLEADTVSDVSTHGCSFTTSTFHSVCFKRISYCCNVCDIICICYEIYTITIRGRRTKVCISPYNIITKSLLESEKLHNKLVTTKAFLILLPLINTLYVNYIIIFQYTRYSLWPFSTYVSQSGPWATPLHFYLTEEAEVREQVSSWGISGILEVWSVSDECSLASFTSTEPQSHCSPFSTKPFPQTEGATRLL